MVRSNFNRRFIINITGNKLTCTYTSFVYNNYQITGHTITTGNKNPLEEKPTHIVEIMHISLLKVEYDSKLSLK